ncbi:MAG: ADP-ribosylation factor-like protein [Candidatus Heimdallarchaeota archaeon]
MSGVAFGESKRHTEKILLMGLAESGKSTIVSVAFEGHSPPPRDARYDATLEYIRKNIEVNGEKLTIFDVGGQRAFLDRFTGELAEFIFSEASALIFVVDLTKLEELSRAKFYFDKCLKNLEQFSPTAQVFLFLHKKDLITDELEFYEYSIKPALLSDVSVPVNVHFTSVYDNSIYEATEAVLGSVDITAEELESIIVSFRAKTNAKSVEVLSLKGEPVPLTRVGEVIESLKVYENLDSNLIDAFTADSSDEEPKKLTGAVLETNDDMKVWRRIGTDLLLTVTFSKSDLLEIYPSVLSLTSRLGSAKKPRKQMTEEDQAK